jgi:hypothetical protein
MTGMDEAGLVEHRVEYRRQRHRHRQRSQKIPRGAGERIDRVATEQRIGAPGHASGEQSSHASGEQSNAPPIGGTGSFEKVLSPSAMTLGFDRGVGCYPERLSEAERSAPVVPDQFQHEIATAFNLKGRGLVILTSCSHRGVVNAIRQAQAASGVEKIHAVIGDFHLAPYQEEYVRDTVKALQEIDPTYVILLHCTGEPLYEIARAAMPAKLVSSYTGHSPGLRSVTGAPALHQARNTSYRCAMHSTSMRNSARASAATITVERAGESFGKNVRHTSFIGAKSAWRVRNTVHLSTVAMVAPAASTTA